MDWPLVRKRIYVNTGLALVCLSLVSGLWEGPFFVTGVLLGGLLAMGNLYVMQDNIVRCFSKGEKNKGLKLPVIGKFYLRLTLLGLLVFLLLKWGIPPVALVVGFSSLVLGIISLVFVRSIKKTGEAA